MFGLRLPADDVHAIRDCMSKKRLIENALSLSAVQVVTLGLPLLSLPYLALTLGAEQLGRLAFVMSIVQVILVFADYGFNLSASKAVSLHRHDKVRIAEIWVSVTPVSYTHLTLPTKRIV